ncbi:MAG: M15 family metallopeptidase [Treponema sp.]|nr:M15 family metallopeptidase [Treponema sp.]
MSEKEKMTVLFILLFMLAAGNISAGGNKQVVIDEPLPPLTHVSQFFQVEIEKTIEPLEQPPVSDRAELVMTALAAAYPRRIERAEFRNGDWAVLLRGTWYYFADGKLLPENLLEDAEKYNPQPFYGYPEELPPWRKPTPEEAALYSELTKNRSISTSRRSQAFMDDLWRAHNADEAYQRVKTIRLFGREINVHYAILEDLSLAEDAVLTLARSNPQVQTWVNNIGTVHGWNWRKIEDTDALSLHSYGTAVDILPKSLGNKETYWLWAMRKKPDWWNVSYNERYHPPAAVVKAFESYGFIWGGKWQSFDTMHFEYRPEILLLNGLELETVR